MLAGFLNGVEVFTIWSTVVLAIGLREIAKLSKGKAWTVAVLMWFLGALMAAAVASISA
jgi:hypothetical protein